MRFAPIVILLCMIPLACYGQTTQPTDLQQSQEIVELHKEVARLRAENEALKAQNTQLVTTLRTKYQMSVITPKAPNGVVTVSMRIEEYIKKYPRDSENKRKSAKQIDAKIAKYLMESPADPRVVEALYECKPCVGMTMDQLKVISFNWLLDSESVDGSVYRMEMCDPLDVPRSWTVGFSTDKKVMYFSPGPAVYGRTANPLSVIGSPAN